MSVPIVKQIGHRVAHKAFGRFLDPKLGFVLLRDRRVSGWTKFFVLVVGAAVTALLVAFEFPLEALLAFALPFLGGALDLVFDGLELVLVPLLVACVLLPFVVPKDLVGLVRDEREGVLIPNGPPTRFA